MITCKNIKLFLLDMDGTVYLEDKLLGGALEAIARIRGEGAKLCFLTNNSSRSKAMYIEKLHRLGIEISAEEIYTSADATVDYLKAHHAGQSVYLVGTEALKEEFVGGGICLTQQMPDVVVLGFDTDLTYEKLVKLTRYVALGATFIATHPDINCPAKDVYIPDVGSMLALVKESTGKTPSVICGKPFQYMADGILKRFGVSRGQIAMVGDRLGTDILFAQNNGFRSALVLSGETTPEMLKKSGICPDWVLVGIGEL